MKDSKKYAAELAKLYNKLKKSQDKVKPVVHDDPVEALVLAIICDHLPLKAAKSALKNISKHFVDLNDLRVSRSEEVVEVLGCDDEEIRNLAHELNDSLNAIFTKYDTMDLEPLKEEGKRQAKKELEEVEGLSKFAISYCFLTAFDGHAIPVSKTMGDYLIAEGMVHPKAKLKDIEGFLERQINSANAYEFFVMLKTVSDEAAEKEKKAVKKAAKKKATAKKKTTKKKVAKKEVKKTAKKKVVKKTTVKRKAVKKVTKKKTAKKPIKKKK